MIGVLNHDSTLQGYTGPGTTWANEMKFVMNHAESKGLWMQRNLKYIYLLVPSDYYIQWKAKESIYRFKKYKNIKYE